jgi:hypothetical protein
MIGGLYATEENLEAERKRIEQRNREYIATAAARPYCLNAQHLNRTIKDGANKVHISRGRRIAVPQPGEKYARKLQKEMAKGLHFDWS